MSNAVLINSLPDADMLDKLGLLIQKIVAAGGWKFSCLVPDENNVMTVVPVDAALLGQKDQLMGLVLHRATRLFYDVYREEPYVAYRYTEGQPLSVVAEFEPGNGTASLALWGLVVTEAFDQLANEPRPDLALEGYLALDEWFLEFQNSLDGLKNSRKLTTLPSYQEELVETTPEYTLTQRQQPTRLPTRAGGGFN